MNRSQMLNVPPADAWSVSNWRAGKSQKSEKEDVVKNLQKESAAIKKQVIKDMDSYKFSKALDALYEFLWHRLADFYIEELKEEVQSGNIVVATVLEEVYLQSLILLHPFVPFVTEAVWKEFKGEKSSILDELIKLS